ncbi:protein 4.1 isoform X5 [Ictalurus punctatus]|uniref:Protein 4.1 n=1 Tax=Ictalurus punctatus TaxID=7998 RepID=A0A2D0S4K4_ICTPU|nr:protein 4.1 isoform X5 [Ictalurus punctatus]
MTTDKANNGQKKQVCEQQQEDGEAGVQEPDPIEPHQDGPSSSPLTPGGSEEGQQPKLRQHTPGGRGLSRLFSSFLKRHSQCSDDEGAKVERGQEKESHLDPKAPIADPEPELRNEGDAALDLHSISSSENQVRVDQKDTTEGDELKVEKRGTKEKKHKKEEMNKNRDKKIEKAKSAEKKEKKEKRNKDKIKNEEGKKEKENEIEEDKDVGEQPKPGEEETEAAGAEKMEGDGERRRKGKSAEEEVKALKGQRRPRILYCRVTLLDDTLFECELDKHAKGQELFAKVCEHLNLLEKDYYGLAVWETPAVKTWLDFTKEIRRQVPGINYDFTFNVKFYPPDPAQLSEDITRYYVCLQLRKDIMSGRLPCSFVTLTLLGSYALQSELGEYDPEVHGTDYAKELRLIPSQTKELEDKVMELHRTYRSMSPAQADMMFLENAKKLSMYGVDLHQAKDLNGVDIMLGVCSSGLLVYKDKLRINRFPWPKVLKVSYKRSSFFIKIRPSELEHYESAIGFKLPNYKASKKLWKVCVEHHTFFRLTSTEAATTPRKLLALGSKFRYSGRTQAQTRQASSMINRPAPHFKRFASKTASHSLDGAMVPTLNKTARPVSAPIMSPVSIGDTAPSPTVTSAVQVAHKDLVTPTSPPSPSGQNKVEVKAESCVTGSFKMQSVALEDTSEIKMVVRREWRHRDALAVTTTNGGKTSQPPQVMVRMRKKRAKKIEGETLYTRHSNLMLEDLDKTQSGIMRHHSSISELKRSFMASVPEPRPSEWDKRLSTHSPFRTANINGQMQPDVTPVVKTHTITVSDVTNSPSSETATKEGPIVHTETKTITYASAQPDENVGMLLNAQTITSDTLSTTTTTQITKRVKGGISETRIEKRIVITGDSEIDHDKALAQAIKEAKEQHPDMSVTKVVVHQETEITPE